MFFCFVRINFIDNIIIFFIINKMLKFCIKFNDFIIILFVDFIIGYVYKNIGGNIDINK